MYKLWCTWKLRILISLSLIFIVGLGVFLALKLSAVEENHTITLSDNGFYPDEITIKKGEALRFVTKRDKAFWPASNLHPTHEIYPEFDSKKPVPSAGEWSFRFDKAGQWKYHDHLFANAIGKIIVLDEAGKIIPTAADNCLEMAAGEKQQCWDEQLETTLETQGLDAAFDFFIKLYKTDPKIPKACHAWGHILGETAFDLYAKQKDFLLREEASYCGYGFYHGFLEELLLMTGDITEARTFCDYVSTQLNSDSAAYVNCVHGVGHGVTAGTAENPTEWETPQDIIDVGLKTCEKFTNIPTELRDCWEGAYNGFLQLLNNNQYGLSLDLIKDDFFLICRTQKEKYQAVCYTELMGFLSWFSGSDFSKATTMIIEEIQNPELRAKAIARISADFMQDDIVKLSHDKNVLVCRSLQNPLYKSCFQGILRGFASHGEPKKEHVKGLNFCRSEILSVEEKDTCFRYILNSFNFYERSQEEIEQVCQGVEVGYKKYCS